MSAEIQPRMGKGQFQWNVGSWFGPVVGGTAWMMITAGFLVANWEIAVAAVPFSCFLTTNLVACGLWTRRERLEPFFSLMVLLSVLAISTPVAWMATREWASPETLSQMNWPSSAVWNVVVSLIVPGSMVWFYVLERRAKSRHSADGQQRSTDAN